LVAVPRVSLADVVDAVTFPDLAAILVFGSILGPILFLLFWPRKEI